MWLIFDNKEKIALDHKFRNEKSAEIYCMKENIKSRWQRFTSYEIK